MPPEASARRAAPGLGAELASRWTLRRLAGVAYLVPAVNIAAIGYMLLFVAPGGREDWTAALHELLVENPRRAIFWWLALLALCCLALAAAYLSGRVKGAARTIPACAAGLLLAAAAWATLDASICAVVTLPLLFSVPDAARVAMGKDSIAG